MVMGLTALTGDPVMCILVLKETGEDGYVDVGLDEFATVVGEQSDVDFILKNSGQGKCFLEDQFVSTGDSTYLA